MPTLETLRLLLPRPGPVPFVNAPVRVAPGGAIAPALVALAPVLGGADGDRPPRDAVGLLVSLFVLVAALFNGRPTDENSSNEVFFDGVLIELMV